MPGLDITLNVPVAVVLVFVAVIAGYRYRRTWVAEGPRRLLWLYGLLAAGSLLALGLIPLA